MTDDRASSSHSLRKWLRSHWPAASVYARIIALVIGIAFIFLLLLPLIKQPQRFTSQISPWGFLLSIIAGIVSNAVIAAAFVRIVGKTAPTTTKLSRIKAYYYAQIAKYIPGRIVALMMQKSILDGPSSFTATIVSNLELTGISLCLCSGAALSLLLCVHSFFLGILAAFLFIGVGAMLLKLDWIELFRGIYSYFSGREFEGIGETSKAKHSIVDAVFLSFLLFLLPAASIYVLLEVGMRFHWPESASFSAFLLFSWVGGMIAFVFPAGIGIRELVFFSLGGAFAGATASETLAGIALASRAMQIFADVAGWILFVGIYRVAGMNKIVQSSEPKNKVSEFFAALKYGVFLILEKLMHWCIHPHLRAFCLRLAGASIGKNVRVYECSFFNLQEGFRHLQIANDVHIGYGCLFDLSSTISIGERSTLSPGITLLTHADPGTTHGSKLVALYPRRMEQLKIGKDCWIGANVILLCGVEISDSVVVGAGSVVTRNIEKDSVAVGVPAVVKHKLSCEIEPFTAAL